MKIAVLEKAVWERQRSRQCKAATDEIRQIKETFDAMLM